MSPNEGRVSLSRTKPSLLVLVPRSSRPTTNAVRWLSGKVRPALMPGKRFVSLTDEVSRGSSSNSISCLYKAMPKGSSDAPEAGTATPWPRSQGCLQRQSMSSAFADRKAKPQSDSNASASSWDKLALAKNGLLRLVLHCERSCLGGSGPAPSAEPPILGTSSALHRNRTRPRVIGVARCGKSARRPNMRN
jgi:hypothetical protein